MMTVFTAINWVQRAYDQTGKAGTATVHTLGALMMDWRWSSTSINLLLNEPDERRRDEMTAALEDNKLADIDRVVITVRPLHLC